MWLAIVLLYRVLNSVNISILRHAHRRGISIFPVSEWADVIAVGLWISSFSMQVAFDLIVCVTIGVNGFPPSRWHLLICFEFLVDVLSNLLPLPCYSFKELEENLRDAQSASQRLETQLVQKERLYEDKIKVRYRYLLTVFTFLANSATIISVVLSCLTATFYN